MAVSVASRSIAGNSGVALLQSDVGAAWPNLQSGDKNPLAGPTLAHPELQLVSSVWREYPDPYGNEALREWVDRISDGTPSAQTIYWDDAALEYLVTGSAESAYTYRQSSTDGDKVGELHASGSGGFFQYFTTYDGAAISALAGQTVTFECDVKLVSIGGDTVFADTRAIIYGENSGGANIGPWTGLDASQTGTDFVASIRTTDGNLSLRSNNGGLGVWQRLRVTGTVPTSATWSAATKMRVRIEPRIYLNGHTITLAPTVTMRIRRARFLVGSEAPWMAPATQAGSTLFLAVATRGPSAAVINDPAGWTLAATVTSTAGAGVAMKVYKIENSAARTGIERVTLTTAAEATMSLIEVASGGAVNLSATDNNGDATSTTQRTGSITPTVLESCVGFIAIPNTASGTSGGSPDSTEIRNSGATPTNTQVTMRRSDKTTSTGPVEFTNTTGGNVAYAGAIFSVPEDVAGGTHRMFSVF